MHDSQTKQHPAGKPVSQSATVLATLVETSQTNAMGNIHGGTIMKLADQACGAAAIRHSQRICVTASIDRLDFLNAVHVGDLVTLKSSVNYVHRTSMEVGVKIEAENMTTGVVKHVASAYLIFVALDENCKPVAVAPVIPHTEAEKLRYRQAELRYKQRQENRAQQRALLEAQRTAR
ncbi:MAG TPA: acyl-CoA thioesterase [Candidatus Eremiobacteraceae bacterium]|nr:acyl-CoA thioesterase [Candidatus Eremiobacteraceae bacterium]